MAAEGLCLQTKMPDTSVAVRFYSTIKQLLSLLSSKIFHNLNGSDIISKTNHWLNTSVRGNTQRNLKIHAPLAAWISSPMSEYNSLKRDTNNQNDTSNE